MQHSCLCLCSCTGKSTAGCKLGAVVAEVNLFILDMDDHIQFPILIDIAKRKRNRYLLIPGSDKVWPYVIDGLCRVARGQFDNNYLTMKVEGDEVTGMCQAIIIVPNNLVSLKHARIAVNNIIVFGGSPCEQRRSCYPHGKRRKHTYAHIEQPMYFSLLHNLGG